LRTEIGESNTMVENSIPNIVMEQIGIFVAGTQQIGNDYFQWFEDQVRNYAFFFFFVTRCVHFDKIIKYLQLRKIFSW